MMVLPLLISCATLDHEEAHTNPVEKSRDVAVKPTPMNEYYGKLRKISSPADTLFDFDSSILKPSSIQVLKDFARELQNVTTSLRVIGYTDRLGPDYYNKELSFERAETVKIYLISKGIDPDIIFTEGRGESNPLTGDTCRDNMEREMLIECLAPDRRVEIRVK